MSRYHDLTGEDLGQYLANKPAAKDDDALARDMLDDGLGLAALGGLTGDDATAANAVGVQMYAMLVESAAQLQTAGRVRDGQRVAEAAAAIALRHIQTMKARA